MQMQNNGLTNEKYIINIIVKSILTVLAIIIPIIILINLVPNIGKHRNSEELEDRVWEEAYKNAVANKIGIQFNGIETSEEQYGFIRSACNDYVEDLNNIFNKYLSIEVAINEQTFVDGTEDITEDITEDSEDIQEDKKETLVAFPDLNHKAKNAVRKRDKQGYGLVETNTIYFNNLMMIRYVNSQGNIAIVFGAYRDSDGAFVIEKNRLYEYTGTIDFSNIDTESINSESITEEQYLYEVNNCIEKLLEGKAYEASNKIVTYITSDGRKSIDGIKKHLDLSSEAVITPNILICGKSDTSLVNKDRIYAEYTIKDGENEQIVSFVIKLNNNYRIFDIDIV